MKVRKPITERMASRMAGEHTELKSYVEEVRTVFLGDDDLPVFEKVEISNPLSAYGLVSYFAYVDVKEGD